MSYYQKYLSRFKNVEDQQVIVRIEDRFSFNPNPYGLWYQEEDNGGGTQTTIVYWSSIPAGCTSVRIVATTDGFTPVDEETFGTGSPATWSTLASGVYIYLLYFEIPVPGDDELFILNELAGVTDELEAAGDPLHFIVNNNSQDKLATIYGLQAVFQFNSDSNNNLSKLLRGAYSDKRYFMTVAINDEEHYVFKGFISLADMQESFLPHSNVTTITATDGLGGLKNIPLKTFTDENPTGKHKIIEFIAWCLRFTGLQENINVVMNVREEWDGIIAADPSGHIYNTQYLDAKTMEAEIGECLNCYTVLQYIFKHTCFIGQRHGTWWIKNVDEFDEEGDYVAVFNYLGEFTEMKPVAFYTKNIGRDENMWWSKESCMVSFTSPHKFAKDSFKYNTPKEVPCNVDFERGALTATISETDKHYNLECWDKLFSNTSSDDPATADIYIRRIFFNGYEKERYVVIEGNSDFNFIMSEGITVHAKDKFNLSVQRRLSSDVSGSGSYRDNHVQVRLYGDDDSYWTHHGRNSGDNEIKWYACDAAFRTYQKFYSIEGDAADDLRENAGLYDGETAEIPVDGTIKILLYRSSLFGDTRNTYLNFSFEYLAFINGSYQKFTGQYHKVSVADDNNENTDEEVYISDAPKKLFKGALHKYDGANYVLSGLFWKATKFLAGMPPDEDRHPFGYIQAFNLWNQVRLLCRKLSGSVQGIESSSQDALFRSDIPTVFHTYKLTDTDEHTSQKKFMCLSYDMDLYKCEWIPVLAEVMDESRGKAFNDDYEFKYITQ